MREQQLNAVLHRWAGLHCGIDDRISAVRTTATHICFFVLFNVLRASKMNNATIFHRFYILLQWLSLYWESRHLFSQRLLLNTFSKYWFFTVFFFFRQSGTNFFFDDLKGKRVIWRIWLDTTSVSMYRLTAITWLKVQWTFLNL